MVSILVLYLKMSPIFFFWFSFLTSFVRPQQSEDIIYLNEDDLDLMVVLVPLFRLSTYITLKKKGDFRR